MKIELEGIRKSYGGRAVLDGLTLEARSGEILALLGPSGAGKSTILLAVAGLVTPDEGCVLFDGSPAPPEPRERRVGMMFQDLALWPHMTVQQHLSFVAPSVDHRRLLEQLELAGVARSRPGSLSGGEARRLALARAVASSPRALLLDEPFGSLDRPLRDRMLDLVRELHDSLWTTSIFVTHDYDEAFRIGDRVAVLHSGKVAQVGAPSDVYSSPVSRAVAELTGPVTEWPGEPLPLRPEQLVAAPDGSSSDCVVGCRFRGGRWVVEVARDGRRFLAESPTRLPAGTRVLIRRIS